MAIITVTVFTIAADLNSMGSEVQCGLMHTDATKKALFILPALYIKFQFYRIKTS